MTVSANDVQTFDMGEFSLDSAPSNSKQTCPQPSRGWVRKREATNR